MLSSTPSLGGSRSSPNARQAKNLSGSASLPQLAGTRPSLPDKIHAMAEGLHTHELKSRQRLFASHAHDTQLLQQMVSVLMQRANKAPTRDRGERRHIGLLSQNPLKVKITDP